MHHLNQNTHQGMTIFDLAQCCRRLAFTLCLALFLTPAFALDQHIPTALHNVDHIHRPHDQHFSAGQPTAEQFQAFAEQGVRHVVDLRPPEESADINSAAWVSAAGMAYYHIPIAGGGDLNRQHVAVLDTILQRINDEPALLHCASSNRVGAMMALHAVWHQGMDTEEAIQLGKDYGLASLEGQVRAKLNEE